MTLSDRASAGEYEDLSGPEIERVLAECNFGEAQWIRLVIPDDRRRIEVLLCELCDAHRCDLVWCLQFQHQPSLLCHHNRYENTSLTEESVFSYQAEVGCPYGASPADGRTARRW